MSYKEKLNMTQGCACTEITSVHLASQGVLGGREGLGASPSVFSRKHAEHILPRGTGCGTKRELLGHTVDRTSQNRSAACDLPSLMPHATTRLHQH